MNTMSGQVVDGRRRRRLTRLNSRPMGRLVHAAGRLDRGGGASGTGFSIEEETNHNGVPI